jgi:hypothetical protein
VHVRGRREGGSEVRCEQVLQLRPGLERRELGSLLGHWRLHDNGRHRDHDDVRVRGDDVQWHGREPALLQHGSRLHRLHFAVHDNGGANVRFWDEFVVRRLCFHGRHSRKHTGRELRVQE